MPKVKFKTRGGRIVSFTSKTKERKGKARKRRSFEGVATGKCRTVKSGKGKCTIKLCHTGEGVSGWTFTKGTRRCPA